MRLVEVSPDDPAALRVYVDAHRAVARHDTPWERPLTTYRQAMELRIGYEGEGGRGFLVEDAGATVGYVELYTSEYDNLEMAWVSGAIVPSARGRGLGRAALEVALDEARAAGRTMALLWGLRSPALDALAASAGFEEKSVEARRLHELSGPEQERAGFRALHDEAAPAAADYELVRIAGRSPEELLPRLLAVTEAINDAPTDDLDVEDEVYDLDRIRAYEQAQIATGFRLYRLLARHRGTGEIVGHTVVTVDGEQPAWAEQHDTTVVPAHRGHRLGLVLKTAMLGWLAEDEPQVRHLLTENAASNGPMIDVNERLGHRLVGLYPLYQRAI